MIWLILEDDAYVNIFI